MPSPEPEKPHKWLVLILAALTNTVVVAIPSMSMSVLFKEIAGELNLSLVQVGFIWGIAALPGIAGGLVGGAIGDRFGPRRVLTLGCVLAGSAGALRGLSSGFPSLVASVCWMGLLAPVVTMSVFKTCGLWFPRRQLGLANGFLSIGMALGFLVSSLVSATVLSPWLGGWRNVFFAYGALAVAFCLPWYITRTLPVPGQRSSGAPPVASMRAAMAHVARLPNLWFLGLTILGVSGCIQGMLGYLPLYLRGLGWPAASADGALATFHTVSLLLTLPIALGSDRLGSRRMVLLGAALMIALGAGLLSVTAGWGVWLAVILTGMVRDGFMAIFLTMIVESDGVGPVYAGSATGFVMIFVGLGGLLAPPLGNSLAGIAPSAPFVFWMALTLLGIIGILLARESGLKPAASAASA